MCLDDNSLNKITLRIGKCHVDGFTIDVETQNPLIREHIHLQREEGLL
jgi:hypothetical protein